MLFYSEFKRCLPELSHHQRSLIIKNIVTINLILMVMVCLFALRIERAKNIQEKFLQVRTSQQHIPLSALSEIHSRALVDAKVYMFYVKDINLKETSVPITFALSMTYARKDFPHHAPEIELNNGTIITTTPYFKSESKGEVNEVIVYDAEVLPVYQMQLYPLDKQLVSIRPSAKDWLDKPFYLRISGMYLESDAISQNSDYNVIKSGYANPIAAYSMMIGNSNREISSIISRAYMVYDHKNIYTYIKNIQYIVLSLLIALFSLLINSKTSSPKNGRVAVIGSSVFSLAANAFQINATVKATNVFTLIDLITVFAGMIILMCYITTVRTLKLIDSESYETSKVFDLSVFYCLLSYVVIFFISIYIYA